MSSAPDTRNGLRSWRAVRRMPVRELATTSYVLVLAVLLEIALRLLPLPSVASLFGVAFTEPDEDRQPITRSALGARERTQRNAVDRVLRHWLAPDAPCLRRALLLGHLLRQHGPTLRIGVARTGEQIEAHAWLEFPDGTIGFNPRYVALDSARPSP